MTFLRKTAPFYTLAIFYLIVSFFIRVILIFHPITQASFSIIEIIKIVSLGFLSDLFIFTIVSSFLWFYLIFISNSKYLKPFGYIIFGMLVFLLIYIKFFNTILNEYGGVLPEIGFAFVAIKTTLFGLLLFLPKYRDKIRYWLFSFVIFLYVAILLQTAISEYFFWNEFGVRFNFIAVDYLVYTNEVIGNIMQSYPVIPLFSGLYLTAGVVTYFIVKNSKNYIENIPTFNEKLKITGIGLNWMQLFC
jgi:hypothetical protein